MSRSNWVFIFLLCLPACSQQTPIPVTAYLGSVVLVDEFGAKLADKSGVTVSVVDQPGSVTTTDATGSFTLNVPQGTQRLSFAKAGYGTCLSPQLTVTATPPPMAQPVTLGQTSSTFLTYFREWAVVNYGDHYQFTGRLNAPSTPTQVRYHRIFYATSKDVSPTNYRATSLYSGSFADPGGNPTWYWVSDYVSPATINSVNASPTDKIYGVVYGDNPAADTYLDPTSGRTVYPALSKQASDVFDCNR